MTQQRTTLGIRSIYTHVWQIFSYLYVFYFFICVLLFLGPCIVFFCVLLHVCIFFVCVFAFFAYYCYLHLSIILLLLMCVGISGAWYKIAREWSSCGRQSTRVVLQPA